MQSVNSGQQVQGCSVIRATQLINIQYEAREDMFYFTLADCVRIISFFSSDEVTKTAEQRVVQH